MVDYSPPIQDLLFTLEHIAGLPELAASERFAHADPDTVAGALEELGRFMSEVFAPLDRVGDTEGVSLQDDGTVRVPEGFAEAYRKLVDAGWGALGGPQEHGGAGFPNSVVLSGTEFCVAANMAFSMLPMLTVGTVEALTHHGTPEQQATYLPKLLTGEWSGTMNLTEPEAGSDVGALRTKAEPIGDGRYRITGTKIYISWGEHDLADNIVHLVLARTPGAPAGTKGISLFVVPKYLVNPDGSLGERNDIRCVSLEHKMGIHASPTCVLSFGDEGGAIGELVGEENRGMRLMFTMMNHARIGVGIQGVAVADRAYQQALAYAQERRQGRAIGAPADEHSLIIEHPDVRRMLMWMRSHIDAMRGVVVQNAALLDRSAIADDPEEAARWLHHAELLTPITKAWLTDLGVELASMALQVFGGMGFVEETGIAQRYRDARIAPIYEGTNGIQAMDLVGRKLPLGGGAVVGELFDWIAESAEAARAIDELGPTGENLADALEALRGATTWLMEHGLADPNQALAGATPYLRLMGTVVGGWVQVRLAQGALADLESGRRDADELRARIASARFYGEQVLPTAAGLVPQVQAGTATIFATEPKYLASR